MTRLMKHVVVEPIPVVSAQSIDGGEPHVPSAITHDIPHKIVGQSIFHIDGMEEKRSSQAGQDGCPSQPQCYGT